MAMKILTAKYLSYTIFNTLLLQSTIILSVKHLNSQLHKVFNFRPYDMHARRYFSSTLIHADTFEAPVRPVEKPFRCSVADIFKGMYARYVQ